MIYTKTGDKGTTSLVGGRRVKKCDPRVEAYGSVDELNAHVGLLAEMLRKMSADHRRNTESRSRFGECCRQLKIIQNRLFVVQTLLATEDGVMYKKLPQLEPSSVEEVEGWIDSMDGCLPKLNSFVIPGGSVAAAQAHVARTVCRRAERMTVRLADEEKIEEILMKFINRTSDYLFVLSRYILLLERKAEIFWSVE